MSTKLKAGTSTSGAVIDADTTGILELQSGSTPTTALTIDTSQRLLAGSSTAPSSPAIKLNLYGGAGANTTSGLQLTHSSGSFGGGALADLEAGGMTFYTFTGNVGSETYSERMRIDSNGNLLVGTTSVLTVGKVSVLFDGSVSNGIVLKTSYASTGSDFARFYNSAGTQTGSITQNGTTTTSFVTSSDYRLKENIAPMQNALNVVQQLKPVTYNWKSDGSDGQGFIAHELQEVCPDAVTGEKDAVNEDGTIKPQGIDTSFLVATLTAAIQELKAELDATKAEVAALKVK